MSAEYMQEKIIEWNPNWDPSTVTSWDKIKLYAIYRKEQKKVQQQIYLRYGYVE